MPYTAEINRAKPTASPALSAGGRSLIYPFVKLSISHGGLSTPIRLLSIEPLCGHIDLSHPEFANRITLRNGPAGCLYHPAGPCLNPSTERIKREQTTRFPRRMEAPSSGVPIKNTLPRTL